MTHCWQGDARADADRLLKTDQLALFVSKLDVVGQQQHHEEQEQQEQHQYQQQSYGKVRSSVGVICSTPVHQQKSVILFGGNGEESQTLRRVLHSHNLK